MLSGRLKTAFLQGDASEVKEDIYGLPPPEEKLQMRPGQVLRIVKQFLVFLNLPSQTVEWLKVGKSTGLIKVCFVRLLVVVCALSIHVDDFLRTDSGRHFDASGSSLAPRRTLPFLRCEMTQDLEFCLHQNGFSQQAHE